MQNIRENMVSDQYAKLIRRASVACAEERIIAAVTARIERARLRDARLRASVYGIFVIGAAAAFLPAWNFLVDGANKSGFFKFLSLLAGNGTIILSAWKELVLSLAEALPILEISALTAVVLVFIYSTRSVVALLANFPLYRRGHIHVV